jgi:serine/threonine protein kinase
MIRVEENTPFRLSRGTAIGPYKIAEPIGAGGMGEVYAAIDTRLPPSASEVAIKLLFNTSDALSIREVAILRQIDHPNVVRLFDFGEWKGRLYLVMEFLRGHTLRELIRHRNGPLSWDEARSIAIEICKALSALHAKGIVHRDVKPQNLLIVHSDSGSRLKLLDFGIARHAQPQDHTITVGAHFVGTAAYASPEQFVGGAISPQTDLYSLGCVLYELVTGQPPFLRPTQEALLVAHAKDKPEPPSLIQPGLARSVDRLILMALEKEPNHRFRSADEMIKSLAATKNWSASHALGGLVVSGVLIGLMLVPLLKGPHIDATMAPAPPSVQIPKIVEAATTPPTATPVGKDFDPPQPPMTPNAPTTPPATPIANAPVPGSSHHHQPKVVQPTDPEATVRGYVTKAVTACRQSFPIIGESNEMTLIIKESGNALDVQPPKTTRAFSLCVQETLNNAHYSGPDFKNESYKFVISPRGDLE